MIQTSPCAHASGPQYGPCSQAVAILHAGGRQQRLQLGDACLARVRTDRMTCCSRHIVFARLSCYTMTYIMSAVTMLSASLQVQATAADYR